METDSAPPHDGAAPPPQDSSEPARLRDAELSLARMQGEIGPGIRERVARLEKGQESLATKVEVERAKVWGMASLLAAWTSILVLIIRLISWLWPDAGPLVPGGD